MNKLTLEQETTILFYIENYQGKSSKHMDRGLMYEIYNFFNPKEGRGTHVCTCLDKDTHGKVNNMISSYTFSDKIRFTPRFHQLLPQLALFKEEEIEVEDNVGKMDMSKFLKPEPKAQSVPVKAVTKTKKEKVRWLTPKRN
jgi:hypothetical protein